MNNKDKLIVLIEKWIKTNNELRRINKYLFEHTELFENKMEYDFQEELYNFFAAKITRFNTDHNKLYKLLNKKQTEQINEIRTIETL